MNVSLVHYTLDRIGGGKIVKKTCALIKCMHPASMYNESFVRVYEYHRAYGIMNCINNIMQNISLYILFIIN